MPSHTCIDPRDPYAQAVVLVEFEAIAGAIRLLSALDASDDDTLSVFDDVPMRARVEDEGFRVDRTVV